MNRKSNTKLMQVQQELATAKDLLSNASHNKQKNNKKKNKNKNKNKSSQGNEVTISKSLTAIKYASAPVNVGAQYGPSYIKSHGSKVQQLADYDAEDGSERVEFSDTLDVQVQANASTATNGFGSSGFQVSLTPNNCSPRLAQYEELYQWYAFRELIIEYCPLISTATSVGYNIGITNNIFQDTALGTFTAQDVNELSPSMSGPVYLPNRMIFRHKGVKLYSTNTDAAPVGTAVQGSILSILDGSPVASTVYGKLRLCGVIDFYKQVPPTSTDPALVLRHRIMHRKDLVSRQNLFDKYFKALAELAAKNDLDIPIIASSKFVKAEDEKEAVVIQPSPYFRFGK